MFFFFFWLVICVAWLFLSSTCVFRFCFFYDFFSRYQFVEFANCTILVYSHQQNDRWDIKINIYIYIYIYIYMCAWVDYNILESSIFFRCIHSIQLTVNTYGIFDRKNRNSFRYFNTNSNKVKNFTELKICIWCTGEIIFGIKVRKERTYFWYTILITYLHIFH